MDTLIASGVVSLGLLIGLLVGWFVNEEEPFTARGLVSAITVLSGAGVIGVFQTIAPTGPTREFWLYPIAMLAGLLVSPPLDVLYNRLYKKKKRKRRNTKSRH